jgi:hypothetical protein
MTPPDFTRLDAAVGDYKSASTKVADLERETNEVVTRADQLKTALAEAIKAQHAARDQVRASMIPAAVKGESVPEPAQQ